MNYYYITIGRDQTISEKLIDLDITSDHNNSLKDIIAKINSTDNFCGINEDSITTNELKGYLGNGTSIYALDETQKLIGLINININVNKIHIQGLCVPIGKIGIGSQLLRIVQTVAKNIHTVDKIDLTCYGEVNLFYQKNGFMIEREREIEDSDDDDELPKIRYDMIFNIEREKLSGGEEKIKKIKKIKQIKA